MLLYEIKNNQKEAEKLTGTQMHLDMVSFKCDDSHGCPLKQALPSRLVYEMPGD